MRDWELGEDGLGELEGVFLDRGGFLSCCDDTLGSVIITGLALLAFRQVRIMK